MSEGNFECKVSGKRESANGIFLTLQIQPDDYDADLATLRVGSELVLGWAEIVNTDVEPIEIKLGREADPQPPTPNGEREVSDSVTTSQAEGGSPKKSWEQYAPAQQAFLLCRDPDFQRYFGAEDDADCIAKLKAQLRIESRSEIVLGTEACARWLEVVALYNLHRARLK